MTPYGRAKGELTAARRASVALMSARDLARGLAVAAMAVCTGCSTVGNGRLVRLDEPAARSLLATGTTTRSDVLQDFGQGTIVHFRSGWETWQYQYRECIAKGWDQVPYIGLITSRLARPTKELIVLFDDRGVVRRWSLQQFDDREIRPGAR